MVCLHNFILLFYGQQHFPIFVMSLFFSPLDIVLMNMRFPAENVYMNECGKIKLANRAFL